MAKTSRLPHVPGTPPVGIDDATASAPAGAVASRPGGATAARPDGASPRRGPGSFGRRRRNRARQTAAGYTFLSPWLIGLLVITAVPTIWSLYLSFTSYDLFSSPRWVGFDNYKRLFTGDPQYWHSVKVTVTYAVADVPLKLSAALAVAMLLARERRGIGAFRALFYLPSLLGGSVALAIVWSTMFGGDGSVNGALRLFGIHGQPWAAQPSTVLGTLVLLGVWQFGAPMVIFLAGLKQIPRELYEAAQVDGAGRWRQFRSVTLPMLSPVIFFNLVLEMIHAFQAFTPAYIVSNGTGGPTDSTLLYTLYLYINGFVNFQMGYAAAMAWVFVIVIGLFTAVLFSTGRFWVHYTDGDEQ